MPDLELATTCEISDELRRRGRPFILASVNAPSDAVDGSNIETTTFYFNCYISALGLAVKMQQLIANSMPRLEDPITGG